MAKIKATAKWVENVRSIADNSRGHNVVLDLGTASGGDNKGPSALELAIMSLADCAVTIFADVCKQSNVEISKMAFLPVGLQILVEPVMKREWPSW